MKKLLVNSSLFACLVTVLVSLWIAAYPISALAASATATCANGSIVTCSSPGSCFAVDSTSGSPGYCTCNNNGEQTAFKGCLNEDYEFAPEEGPIS